LKNDFKNGSMDVFFRFATTLVERSGKDLYLDKSNGIGLIQKPINEI
jgi:hypothetical protein